MAQTPTKQASKVQALARPTSLLQCAYPLHDGRQRLGVGVGVGLALPLEQSIRSRARPPRARMRRCLQLLRNSTSLPRYICNRGRSSGG